MSGSMLFIASFINNTKCNVIWDVRFWRLMKISILVLWVVTPCGLVGRHQRFGEIYCLHLQERPTSTRILLDEISGSHCGEYEDVFWDVAPCSLVEVYRHFSGANCLHHQGDESLIALMIKTAIFRSTVRFWEIRASVTDSWSYHKRSFPRGMLTFNIYYILSRYFEHRHVLELLQCARNTADLSVRAF
jgi:hypothetical protein